MKRNIFVIIASLILMMATAIPVSAAAEHPLRLVDNADILTVEEEAALIEKLDTISNEQECDVCIVTVESLGDKTATEFADDYYDYNGYGMGEDFDGIMLVLSMEERDWAITTHAFGIEAFTDAGQQYIMDKVTSSLSEGNYASGFNQFADLCEDFIVKAKDGEPYDKGNLPGGINTKGIVLLIIPCIIAGAIVSLVQTIREKRSLKTVMKKAGAREYIGNVQINEKKDNLIYKNIEKVLIVDDSDDSGGSTTHVSSSGRTHGGSSGKF